MRVLFWTGLCLTLAACSSPENMSDTIGVNDAAVAEATGEDAQATLDRRVPAEAEAFAFSETEGDQEKSFREFSYSWPRQVSAIEPLAAAFEKERAKQLAEQKSAWAQALADCPEEFVSCSRNFLEVEWQVVADTPRFLSLSSNISTYTGGAHGNYGRGSVVWDRETEEQLDPPVLFTSTAALETALGDGVCKALNAERTKRRGEPVEADANDWASACVPLTDAVVFLGSSDGAKIDRIGVYYGPYVAGAYAEGDFEFTFPVTPEVLKTVKPDYREAFAVAE